MPYYKYKVSDKLGRVSTFYKSFPSEDELFNTIEKSGNEVESVREVGIIEKLFLQKDQKVTRLSRKDKFIFFSNLSQLTYSGFSVPDALQSMAEETKKTALKNLCEQMHSAIKSGKLLSQAMEKYPKIFPPLYIGVVKNSEKTNSISQSIDYVTEFLKKSSQLSSKIMTAIAYPIFLFLLINASIFGAIKFAIPQISEMISAMDGTMPAATSSLIKFGDLATAYWPLFSGGVAMLFLLLFLLSRASQKTKYLYDYLKLSIPFFGNISIKSDIIRFASFFQIAHLYHDDFLDSINMAKDVIKNTVIKKEIEELHMRITNGKEVDKAMRKMKNMPRFARKMFNMGQKSNSLSQPVKNIVYFYETEVNKKIDIVISSIKPIGTLVIAGFIVWISMAVIMPGVSNMTSM